ncbi:hypothetical protein ACSQ67_016662 [Phaseolus vulgaris]
MMLDEKKKLRLAEVLARRQDSPNPPAARGGRRLDNEVTGEGITFKRLRVATSHSSTEAPPSSYGSIP